MVRRKPQRTLLATKKPLQLRIVRAEIHLLTFQKNVMTKLPQKSHLPSGKPLVTDSVSEPKEIRVSKLGINFSERSDKTRKGFSVIYLSVTYNAKVHKKSLSIRCKTDALNKDTFIIKGDETNSNLLQTIESDINQMAASFRLIGRRLDVNSIINNVLLKRKIIDGTPSFWAVCDMVKREITESYESENLSKKSFKRYEINFNRIIDFFEKFLGKTDIQLEDINRHSVERLVKTLREQDNFQPGTIRKVIQFGNRVYRMAINNRWYEYNPFEKIKLGPSISHIDQFLTFDEVMKIYQLKLNVPLYQNIRDVFVFQCFTSLAYTDVRHLTKAHIITDDYGRKIISKAREKTKNVQTVYLFPIALEILQKHNHQDGERCFKTYSNCHHNRVLKEIALNAGIERDVSTHWGRKSFARMMVEYGMSKEGLQGVLGHGTIGITEQFYANTSKDRSIREMQSLTNKLK